MKEQDFFSLNFTTESYIGLFLLYLIILGNYAGELLGCRVQEIFAEIAIAKHMVGFFTLYYFINLNSKNSDPINTLSKTTIMYVLFIISRKIPIHYIIISLISMFIIKFLDDYKNFYYNKPKDEHKYKIINKIQISLCILIACLFIIGFIRYTLFEMKEYKKNWSWYQHIIGKDRDIGCKSLHDRDTLKGGIGLKQDLELIKKQFSKLKRI